MTTQEGVFYAPAQTPISAGGELSLGIKQKVLFGGEVAHDGVSNSSAAQHHDLQG